MITNESMKKNKILGREVIRHKKKGFTLIEVLVAVVIVALLASATVWVFNKIEDGRESTYKSDKATMEKAADSYDMDKTLADDDYTVIDASEALVTNGYIKEPPSNPWAKTGKTQKDYQYYLVKYKPSGTAQTINKVYLGKLNSAATPKVFTYLDPNDFTIKSFNVVNDGNTSLTGVDANTKYFTK